MISLWWVCFFSSSPNHTARKSNRITPACIPYVGGMWVLRSVHWAGNDLRSHSYAKQNGFKRVRCKISRRTQLINPIAISDTNKEPVFHEFYIDREVALLARGYRLDWSCFPRRSGRSMKGDMGTAIFRFSVRLIRRRRGFQLPRGFGLEGP